MRASVQSAQLRTWLNQFAAQVGASARESVVETAQEAAQHARRYPHLFRPRTGNLQASFGWRPAMGLRRISAKLVADTSRAPYAAPLFFGSRPHVIVPVRASALRFVVDGKVVFARRVNHPGNSARPFFDDAARWGGRQLAYHLEAGLTRAVRS